jgi:hypothetical protein
MNRITECKRVRRNKRKIAVMQPGTKTKELQPETLPPNLINPPKSRFRQFRQKNISRGCV